MKPGPDPREGWVHVEFVWKRFGGPGGRVWCGYIWGFFWEHFGALRVEFFGMDTCEDYFGSVLVACGVELLGLGGSTRHWTENHVYNYYYYYH